MFDYCHRNQAPRAFSWLAIASTFIYPLALSAATQVTSIDFQNGANASVIVIKSNSPLAYENKENPDDKQIVLDLKDAQLGPSAKRNLDTSSFNSKVSLISPYKIEGEGSNARVVIQLRDMASASVTQSGNLLKISIPNDGSGNTGGTVQASNAPSADAASAGAGATTDSGAAGGTNEVGSTTTDVAAGAEVSAASAKGANVHKDKLSEFIENRETRQFSGRPISLQMRDADLGDVFRIIGEASGFNIVLGDGVTGKITVSMTEVPWDQALDVILHTKHLGAERNNNLLRIVTLADLTTEKQQELAAKNAADASAQRITRIFPVNYASLDAIVPFFQKYTGSIAASAGGTASTTTSSQNFVAADTRTSSLIIRDTSENIDRMKKVLEILDVQSPQVLIEGKVVEASDKFLNAIGGNIGLAVGANPEAYASFAGGDALSASTLNVGTASGTTNGAQFGWAPSFGFLSGTYRLNAILNLTETQDISKVVASPRSVVLNKESTTITQSEPTLVASTTPGPQGPITVVTPQDANLQLKVTPTVTNEGSVLLDIELSRDVPVPVSGGNAVGHRNIKTKVLVDSGNTLVIGGIYSDILQTSESGIPLLRKIPIVGALFGSEKKTVQRAELFFFVTPRILNPKEAGLAPKT